ncbi:MAG: chloride channel protein [Vulcanococcus sp.]
MLGGALAALLLLGIELLQRRIWGEAIGEGLAPQRSLAWCLAIPSGIGLLLSLIGAQRCARRLPELGDTLKALRHQPPRGGALRQALAGGLALVGGASIGPEALVSHAVVHLSRWIWRGRDQPVSAAALAGSLGFFGTPLAGPIVLAARNTPLLWRWLPGTLAGITGFIAFQGLRGLSGGLQGVPWGTPLLDQAPLPALLPALLAALAGGAVGRGCAQALLSWRRWLRTRSVSRWHALTPVLTGGLIGLASWALPLAAFSGEQQLKPLLLERFDLPAALLVLAGVLKLLLAGLCLETGWRGGLIFPVLTGSAAIGLGLHQLLPGVGDAGLWCGSVVGGSLGTLLPSPLLALVLGLALLRGHGAEALLLGLLISQVTRHGRPTGTAP